MRRLAFASLSISIASSCALTLDFDTDRQTGSGGSAEEHGGGGAGGGIVSAPQGWVASLSAAPAGMVRLQSVVVVGDVSWVGGYYIGESLSLLDASGATQVLHSGSSGLVTFVVGLDGLGQMKTFVPLGASALAEIDTDTWVGTLLHPRDGKLVVASTYRDGETLFDAGTAATGFGWNLTLLEIDEAGSVGWASRCAADVFEGDGFASMSARFGGFTAAGDGTTLFGTTIERSVSISCDTLVGPAGAGDCDAGERTAQSGQLWSLAADGTCSAIAPVETEGNNAPGAPLWLDGLAAAGADIMIGARVASGEVTVQPWGVDLGAATSFGLAGKLAPNGSAASDSLQTLADVSSTLVVGGDEFFAGSMTNTSGALDLLIGKRGAAPLLFGTDDALHDEAVTSLSVDGGALLVTGWMSDGSDMATDLCGAACQGDFGASHVEICPNESLQHDAFWLLLAEGTTPGLSAVGRTMGGCLEQRAVDAHLGADVMTLLLEIQGEGTLDLLGSTATITAPPDSTAGVVVRLPRPAIGN